MQIHDIYGVIRQAREDIIKAMQEQGLTKIDLVMSEEAYAKEEGTSLDDEDFGTEYQDYVNCEAPRVTIFDKHGCGSDYKVVSVSLHKCDNPCFDLRCEGEYDTLSMRDYELSTLTLVPVFEVMQDRLMIDDKEQYVWLFVAEQVTDDENFDAIAEVFATEDAAKRYIHDFVHGDDGELSYAEKRGWKVDVNDPYTFSAYEEGHYSSNHTDAYIEKRLIKS